VTQQAARLGQPGSIPLAASRARCWVTDMRMSDGLPVIHRWAAPGRRRRLVPAATQDPWTRQSA